MAIDPAYSYSLRQQSAQEPTWGVEGSPRLPSAEMLPLAAGSGELETR